MNHISNLRLFPEKGRIVPEINDISIREIIYNKYRVVYKLSNKIEIVYIQHSAKPLDDTKFD